MASSDRLFLLHTSRTVAQTPSLASGRNEWEREMAGRAAQQAMNIPLMDSLSIVKDEGDMQRRRVLTGNSLLVHNIDIGRL